MKVLVAVDGASREVCRAHGRLFFLRLEMNLLNNGGLVVPTTARVRSRNEQLRAEIAQTEAELEGETYFSRD